MNEGRKEEEGTRRRKQVESQGTGMEEGGGGRGEKEDRLWKEGKKEGRK